jgi:hypothetical protein
MVGSKYQFCVDCKSRNDTATTIWCPVDFNPYDVRCPRHVRFLELQARYSTWLYREKKIKSKMFGALL